MTTFQPEEVVDVVLRGVTVDYHLDYQLILSIPGVDEQVVIPLHDDEGGPLRQVIVTRVDGGEVL
jgi:hypothetical protein